MVTLFVVSGICITVIFISLLIIFGILLYDGKIVIPFTSGANVKRARDGARIAVAKAEEQRFQLLTDQMQYARHEITMGRPTPELLALEAAVQSKLEEVR